MVMLCKSNQRVTIGLDDKITVQSELMWNLNNSLRITETKLHSYDEMNDNKRYFSTEMYKVKL
jgi:hypothetical protein